MQRQQNGRTFDITAEHDGDFWYVKVYETSGKNFRYLFEYKINHPRSAESACERAWEIFKLRHLTPTPF